MKLIIKSKEIKIPDTFNSYVEKRIKKLEKFLEGISPDLVRAIIEIQKISGKHKQGQIYQINVNLEFPGRFFRSQVKSEDLYSAIDAAQEELEIEIQKFKTKTETLFKRGARSFKKSVRLSPLARFRKR